MSDRSDRWRDEHALAFAVARGLGLVSLRAYAALVERAITESWPLERLQAALREGAADA